MKKVLFASIVTALFAFPVPQAFAGWSGWIKVSQISSGTYKTCQWARYNYSASGKIIGTRIKYTTGRFICQKP